MSTYSILRSKIISWMFTFVPNSQQVIQMSTDSMTMCTPNWNPYRFNFLHIVKTLIATNITKQKRKEKNNKVSCRVMNAFRGSLPPFHLLLFLAVLISPSPSAFQCEKFKYFECRARLTTTSFCSDFYFSFAYSWIDKFTVINFMNNKRHAEFSLHNGILWVLLIAEIFCFMLNEFATFWKVYGIFLINLTLMLILMKIFKCLINECSQTLLTNDGSICSIFSLK